MSETTQTVIIYRNSFEHSLYESNLVFPIMCACVAMFFTFLIAQYLQKILLRNFSPKSYIRRISRTHTSVLVVPCIASSVAFIATIYFMPH